MCDVLKSEYVKWKKRKKEEKKRGFNTKVEIFCMN